MEASGSRSRSEALLIMEARLKSFEQQLHDLEQRLCSLPQTNGAVEGREDETSSCVDDGIRVDDSEHFAPSVADSFVCEDSEDEQHCRAWEVVREQSDSEDQDERQSTEYESD